MKEFTHKIFGCIVVSLLALIGFLFGQSGNLLSHQDGLLKVHMLDVGQGDALLIQTPEEQTILIDGGPNADVLYRIGELMPFYNNKIDIMILTHPHDDHVNGLNDVLDRYDVGKIYYSGVVHTAPSYISWLERVQKYQIDTSIVSHPERIALSDSISLELIAPFIDFSGERVDHLNNTSLVTRLIYKDIQFLFTGDMEEELEQQVLDSQSDVSAHVLKSGHHGSKTSSSSAFLDAVNPDIVLISAGKDNQYHHPHPSTLKKYDARNYEVYRTDIEGTVTVLSDGDQVWVE